MHPKADQTGFNHGVVMAPDEIILYSSGEAGSPSVSSPFLSDWRLDPELQPRLTNWRESALVRRLKSAPKLKVCTDGKIRKIS